MNSLTAEKVAELRRQIARWFFVDLGGSGRFWMHYGHDAAKSPTGAGREKIQDAYENADKLIASLSPTALLDLASAAGGGGAPIPMVLHCPKCGVQHIDAPVDVEDGEGRPIGWSNPPHRSHLCLSCGHVWRPADVPTEGVAAVKTTGRADSPIWTTPASTEAPEVGGELRAREILAEEYERAINEGPYPTYAEEARQGKGSFTLCAVRAVARALAGKAGA